MKTNPLILQNLYEKPCQYRQSSMEQISSISIPSNSNNNYSFPFKTSQNLHWDGLVDFNQLNENGNLIGADADKMSASKPQL